jgi:hypothetical protein
MPDENRVFDVTKPKHVSPTPTSKPVIVGHQPMVSDPMVRGKEETEQLLNHTPTKINVTDTPSAPEPEPEKVELKTGREDSSEDPASAAAIIEPSHQEVTSADEPATGPAKFDAPVAPGPSTVFTEPSEPHFEVTSMSADTAAPDELSDLPVDNPPADSNDPALSARQPDIQPHANTAGPADNVPQHAEHIEGLHFAEPKSKGSGLKWLLAGLLVLVIAAYLLIDSGLISTGINLPFHIFKQDNNTPPPAANQPAAQQTASQTAASDLPTGFKLYSLSGPSLTFAAPGPCGEPTSTTEQGYSKRGGSNQPSGNYAYLVSFATNKDVQVTVTSSQYLPPARDRLYYDYLQWCTGSNDGKYYQSILNFTTTDKVDEPSTISCDQGPLDGATKLDSSTILQAKATDGTGKTIGDIYIKNLSDKNLPVLRVKDAAMTNGTDIKTLLGTVKSTSNA